MSIPDYFHVLHKPTRILHHHHMAAGALSVSRSLCHSGTRKPFVHLSCYQITKMSFSMSRYCANDVPSMVSTSFHIRETQALLSECYIDDSVVKSLCVNGELKEAVLALDEMEHLGVRVSVETYLILLQLCVNLQSLNCARQVHTYIVKNGLLPNTTLENLLVEIYARCENMDEACYVFQAIVERDVVSWNVIIGGFAQQRNSEKVFIYFSRMMLETQLTPNTFTFLNVLKLCAISQNMTNGAVVHSYIVETGEEKDSDEYVANGLIDMYVQCGSMSDAHKVFCTMCERKRNLVSWNMLICGYAKGGCNAPALELFWTMVEEGKRPNRITFLGALKACAGLGCLDSGKKVHELLLRYGLELTLYLSSALIDMYAKCGNSELGRLLFDKLPERNVVVWTSMISGYVQQGEHEEALKLFGQMGREGVCPNQVTFIVALKACCSASAIGFGKRIHSVLAKMEAQSDVVLQGCLVDMYTKCGSLDNAMCVSDEMPMQDSVLWNGMVAGYLAYEHPKDALVLFTEMEQRGVQTDEITFLSVLKACAYLNKLEFGKEVHLKIIESNVNRNKFLNNMLVDMYHKCGQRKEASKVFNELIERDVVAWNIIMCGHVADGDMEAMLIRHTEMMHASVLPDGVTFLSMLQACASLGALDLGKRYHSCVQEFGYVIEPATSLSNTLIDMYAKCGSIEKASSIFFSMPIRTSVSWNVMIAGYAQHGYAKEAIELFEEMQPKVGVTLDHVTLVAVICACNFAGLVDAAYYYFALITQVYNVEPTEEAIASMVDLLGRAGLLAEAALFMEETRSKSYVVVWKAMLGASRIHSDASLGKHAAQSVLELDPQDTAAFVLLSNICVESISF